MKDDLVIEKKIARYEEEVKWLQKKLKQSQDNLFCAKAELQELNAKIKFDEKKFWENRTQAYLEETKHIDKWHKRDN